MDKKYQIFISSTYEDLKEERSKVVATILKSYHLPIGMEMFSADNVEQWEQIKRTIDSSDYYVLIIKRRYGSVTKEGVSYTEKEYNYAKKKKIPVLAFIIGDNAVIANRDIEKDIKKMQKLQKFTERVMKENPCDLWNNTDELCTMVNQALQKQFDVNERIGWIKSDSINFQSDIKRINEDIVFQMYNKIGSEILRRNGDILLSHDYMDYINERFLYGIKKQTYIDNFNREIILEIQNERINVSITTRIEYINIKKGINYYSVNPRFETEEQANTYKHIEFSINRIDYTDEIKKSVEITNPNRQFPYIVKNEFPLQYDDNIVIVHKTTHSVPVSQFFHVYQLVFPCRSFLTTIMLKNNINDRFRLRTATFSSFNVHTYEKYTSEYRKDDVNTITIGKWSLPGSGYSITLQDSK